MHHRIGEGMSSETMRTPGSAKLKRDLGEEAVNLAIQGEWLRSTEVNKAILELFPDDVVNARKPRPKRPMNTAVAAMGSFLGPWRSVSTF